MTLTKFLASLDPKGAAAPILLDALFSDEEEKAMLLKDRRRFEGDIMNKTGNFPPSYLILTCFCCFTTVGTLCLPRWRYYLTI